MRCPKKIYLVVSKRCKSDVEDVDVFFDKKEAEGIAKSRNRTAVRGVTDWRVEPYVKGD